MKIYKLLLICFFSWSQIALAADKEQVLSKFEEYRSLWYGRHYETPESLPGHDAKLRAKRAEILEFGDQGIEILLSEMLVNPNVVRKEDILGFFDQAKFSNEKILSVVRTLARSQGLDETHPSTLIACIYFLGNYGTQEDIQFLRTFSNHVHEGVYAQVKVAVRRIQKRENGDNSDNPQDSPKPKVAPESHKVVPKAGTIVAEIPVPPIKKQTILAHELGHAEATGTDLALENTFPYWIFIIGGIVAVGLVVIVRR